MRANPREGMPCFGFLRGRFGWAGRMFLICCVGSFIAGSVRAQIPCQTDLDCTALPLSEPQCQRGACNLGSGFCQVLNLENGLSCDDGDSCSYLDECFNGVCQELPPEGCVRVEIRQPAGQGVVGVGSTFNLELVAVAEGCFGSSVCPNGHPLSAVRAVFLWDPAVLELVGSSDACDDPSNCFVCPAGEYNWGNSNFPFDCSQGDAINAPCASGSPPANDGTAMYTVWSQIVPCDPRITACASPSGLILTNLQFKALVETGPGGTPVNVEKCLIQTRTLVASGAGGGGDEFGSVGAPVSIVTARLCDPPIVTTEGSRYIGVTPPAGTEPVAFLVVGLEADVSCVSKYVSYPLNKMVDAPAYKLPSEWGQLHVRGHDLMPNRTFSVRTDCDPANPGTVLSEPVSAKLWWWGEINLDGPPDAPNVDFTDITLVVDAFRGIFNSTSPCSTDADCVDLLPLQSCDLAAGFCRWTTLQTTDIIGNDNVPEGCMPDGAIDFADIGWEVDAFRGLPYPCRVTCP